MALRPWGAAACGLLLASVWCGPAAADLKISIDKSSQTMTVAVDGKPRYVWPVSTGKSGHGTPNGSFRAQWMARSYFSRKYYNSPMPHAIFFHEGYAIHGTEYIRRLGGPASHGCVRLHPANAKTLYELVTEHKRANTRIEVHGSSAIAEKKSSGRKSVSRSEARREAAARSRTREAREERRYRRYEAEERFERPRRPYYGERPMRVYAGDAAYARWYYYYYGSRGY